ncbi:sensor histidine kinase [Aquipluma nitroreducens]|uniref:histidine kinase n=1 Tax=Aquipluma nitroreducens TaxID=2010828 RepID=A0A5K7S7P0_9BACT|nr:PAS domain S-box protein [Aquipluma nitroreducens]BBE17540.1 sensor histidine kinase [Aquipluma nitroreducens]
MEKGNPTSEKVGKAVIDFEDMIAESRGTASENIAFLHPEEYKSIIELSVVGILIGDSTGKIISWNNALENLTGIKQSNAIGLNIWDIHYQLSPKEFKTPDFFNILEKRLLGIINESGYWKRQVYEQKMTRLDGTDITVEISTFVTASQNGNLLVVTHRDISAQDHLGMTLAIQNEALSKLNKFAIELSKSTLEDGLEAIITKRIKDFTGAIGAIFSEYSPENRTLTPKHIELDSGLLETIVTLLDKHVHKIYTVVSDYTYHELTTNTIKFHGSLSEVHSGTIPHAVGLTAQAILKADRFIEVSFLVEGKLYGTSILAMGKHRLDPSIEILENFISLAAAELRRKRSEEALLKSEEMMRTITENAADIILKLDDEGTIIYTSRAFPGYKKEDVIGKNFCDWTATEYHPVMRQALEDVFSKSISQTYQSKALGINHEIRWFLSRLSPVIVEDVVKNAVLILSDITEREKAEGALKESEENYRVIAQSMIDVIFIIDRFGKQLFFNNVVEKVLGYKVEEVVGRSFADFLSKENIPGYLIQLENIFSNGEICNFITQIYHKDGYLVDVEINVKRIKLKGEFVGQGTIRDISAKKRAEEELKNTLDRNIALLGAIPDLMFVFDSNCKIVDFHSESHNQLIVSPELFLGKLVDELLPHEVVIITKEKVEAVLASGEPDYSTYELQIGDELKYFESRYVPCGNKEVLSIVRDISERKKIEESLNVAIESYIDIFNSVSEAIFVLDKSGTFIDINKGAEKMYQYTKDEFVDLSLQSIAANEKNEFIDVQSILKQVYETGTSASFNFWAVRKNGEIFPKDVFVNKGKYFGKDVLIATARDITEQNQAEERIKSKNEELQKINAEKDKFFSIIAHDLRSPFAAFLGLTQMMVQDLPSLKLDNIQEIALLMRDSATNLHRLLENLLQWSRLQQGMVAFDPHYFLLVEKINSGLRPVMEIASNKGVEIVVNIPDGMYVLADENMLESTIRNLVTNAVKFTDKGGKILVSAQAENQSGVQISIKDTGIGMNEKTLENLFRIGELNCRPGTNGEPSTGLGLILCKDFIERHGGKIWAESTEFMGSTFHILLPNSSKN